VTALKIYAQVTGQADREAAETVAEHSVVSIPSAPDGRAMGLSENPARSSRDSL
jgi:hypothetical protein